MSNRPALKSAFDGLRPSIIREPRRALIAPEDESKLLDMPAVEKPSDVSAAKSFAVSAATGGTSETAPIPTTAASYGATLLTRKKREVLIPLTFRIPQTLKEKLTQVAKEHELNQTDLINEGIELNLQRYR